MDELGGPLVFATDANCNSKLDTISINPPLIQSSLVAAKTLVITNPGDATLTALSISSSVYTLTAMSAVCSVPQGVTSGRRSHD